MGLLPTKNVIIPGSTHGYGSLPGHFHNSGFWAPGMFTNMTISEYGHIVYHWKGNLMLIQNQNRKGGGVQNEPLCVYGSFS